MSEAHTAITALPSELQGKIVRIVEGHEIDATQREGFELAGIVNTEVHLTQLGVDVRTKYLMIQNPDSAIQRLNEQIKKNTDETLEALATEKARVQIYANATQRFSQAGRVTDETRRQQILLDVEKELTESLGVLNNGS